MKSIKLMVLRKLNDVIKKAMMSAKIFIVLVAL